MLVTERRAREWRMIVVNYTYRTVINMVRKEMSESCAGEVNSKTLERPPPCVAWAVEA